MGVAILFVRKKEITPKINFINLETRKKNLVIKKHTALAL